MKIEHTRLSEVILLTPDVFRDERGWFTESYSEEKLLAEWGLSARFVQDNHIRSIQRGVLRGIHFQDALWIMPSTCGRILPPVCNGSP